VQKRLPRIEKESRANPKLRPEYEALQAVHALLDNGKPVWSDASIDTDMLRDLFLLTAKPVIYLFNVDDNGITDSAKQSELRSLVAPAEALFVCAKLEDELRGLDEADRNEMLESYGVQESGLSKLIHAAYETLGLQSYLTAGDQEVRAWTIPRGATAPQAAGVIHGDFERGFIAADIVAYPDLIAAGSLSAARAAGKLATVGKTYVMQPDDIVEFKFNVSK
jgi:ribosome-binding ATPase YchF (GTP1/OBG family)